MPATASYHYTFPLGGELIEWKVPTPLCITVSPATGIGTVEEWETCTACGGEGSRWESRQSGMAEPSHWGESFICDECNGEGRIPLEDPQGYYQGH